MFAVAGVRFLRRTSVRASVVAEVLIDLGGRVTA